MNKSFKYKADAFHMDIEKGPKNNFIITDFGVVWLVLPKTLTAHSTFFSNIFPTVKILKHKVKTNPLKILNLFTTAFIFYMIM